MSDDRSSWLTLESPDLRAAIDPLGAQLSMLQDSAGRDLLWDGNPAWWTGRAPVLFPIVGNLAGGRYRTRGRDFALPRHGFARNRRFSVLAAAPAGASLRLRADPETRAVYPFDFALDLLFALQGPTLLVTALVHNRDARTMPASVGFHPAFRWPLPAGRSRAGHFLEFDFEEPAPVRRLDAGGLVSPESYPTPVKSRRLALADELFAQDALIFDTLNSRAVRYGSPGGPHIQVSFHDAQYLGVWSKPGAPFVCIEPWRGLADPAGFAGELAEKPGIFLVPSSGTASLTMAITLLA